MTRLLRYTLAVPAGIVGWMVAVWLTDTLFGVVDPGYPLFSWRVLAIGLLSGVAAIAAAPRGAWWFGAVPVGFLFLVLDLLAGIAWVQTGTWLLLAAAFVGGLLGHLMKLRVGTS